MRAFWAVTRARFSMLLQYRGAAFGGLVTQLFFGLVFIMTYRAFFENSTTPQPMTLGQVITYLWLNQAFFAMQPWQADGEVKQMMRTGSVAYELVKPIQLFWLWMARAVAMRSAPTLLRALPLLLLAYAFFGLSLPPTWESAGWYLLSILAALLLASAMTVVLNATLFWTLSGEGIGLLMPAIIMTLSGQNIPLPFYPDWMQTLLHCLPFRGLLDVPSRIYTGSIPPSGAAGEILLQFAWVAAFLFLGQMLVQRGIRRLCVQGG